jgi:hypothetical protein
MKRIWMKTSMLAAALCAIPTVALAGGWKPLAAEGFRHFVVVDAAAAGSEAVFREAAASVCGAGKPCLVLFWSDEGKAATKMPMSGEQSQAIVAQIRRNPASGQDELLTRCKTSEASERCLR